MAFFGNTEADQPRDAAVWELVKSISASEGKPVATGGGDRKYVLELIREVVEALDGKRAAQPPKPGYAGPPPPPPPLVVRSGDFS